MKRFVQWRLFLASEQCEASLADHVYIFFTEVSFLCLVSSLVRSNYSYLLIGYYVPGTLLSFWCSRVSTAETTSSLRGIYIPVGNTDIKQ